MARKKEQRNFGQILRERRRKLDLTQQEVARRIKTSTPYVGHLEAGKRHPSDKIIGRLAEVLGLPGHVVPMALVPLGWPARPLGPARREPVEAHLHHDRWGQR